MKPLLLLTIIAILGYIFVLHNDKKDEVLNIAENVFVHGNEIIAQAQGFLR